MASTSSHGDGCIAAHVVGEVDRYSQLRRMQTVFGAPDVAKTRKLKDGDAIGPLKRTGLGPGTRIQRRAI
jgi:hypothetical protein